MFEAEMFLILSLIFWDQEVVMALLYEKFLNQLQTLGELYKVGLQGILIGVGVLELWHLIYPWRYNIKQE